MLCFFHFFVGVFDRRGQSLTAEILGHPRVKSSAKLLPIHLKIALFLCSVVGTNQQQDSAQSMQQKQRVMKLFSVTGS